MADGLEVSDGSIESGFASASTARTLSWGARVRAMLAVERALARAQGRCGILDDEEVATVEAATDPAHLDLDALAMRASMLATPVIALLEPLRACDELAVVLHRGATSQDIIDTAMVLQVRQALDALDAALDEAAALALEHARRHRSDPAPGRTLGVHATPVTLGLVAARWADALGRQRRLLADARPEFEVVQFGGVEGGLGVFGAQGIEVMELLADELDLAVPTLPWHAHRDRVVSLAGVLASIGQTVAKVAGDLARGAMTEIGEWIPGAPDGPGSSALPHKRNPVDAVAARAAVRIASADLAALSTATDHEFERAAGAWQAEWVLLPRAVTHLAGAVERLIAALRTVEADPGRALRNLSLTDTGAGRSATDADVAGPAIEGAVALVDRVLEGAGDGSSSAASAGCDRAGPATTESRIVTTSDGVALRVVVDGADDAPALLLLNSLGTDHELWAAQVASWREHWRVVRFDARGHGGSGVPSGPYTLVRLALDAVEVLDAIGITTTAVVGLSLGGLVAQQLLVDHPTRIRAAVLADTAARIGTEEGWLERASTARRSGMDALTPLVLERFFSAAARAAALPAVERTSRTLRSTDPEGYAASCDALAVADLRDALHAVTTPCTVLVGADDVATTVDEARELALRLPDAELVVLEGAGHLANLEQPDAFRRAVDAALTADVSTDHR